MVTIRIFECADESEISTEIFEVQCTIPTCRWSGKRMGAEAALIRLQTLNLGQPRVAGDAPSSHQVL